MAGDKVNVGPGGVSVQSGSLEFVDQGVQGFQVGAQLAAKKQEIELARQEMANKKNSMRDSAIKNAQSALENVVKYNGKAGALNFDIYARNMQLAGMPVDPAALPMIQAEKERFGLLLSHLNADPTILQQHPDIGQQLAQLTSDSSVMPKTLTDVLQRLTDIQKSKISANSRMEVVNTQEAGKNGRTQVVQESKQVIKGINVDALNSADPSVRQAEIQRLMLQQQQGVDAKTTTAAASTMKGQAALGQVEVGERKNEIQNKNVDSLVEWRKRTKEGTQELREETMELRRQALALRKGGQDKRIFTANYNQTVNQLKAFTNLKYQADNDLTLLSGKDVKYFQAKEAILGLSKLITQTGSTPLARERGLEGTLINYGTQVENVFRKYISGNPEQTTITPGAQKELLDSFQRIKGNLDKIYDTVGNRELEARASGGGFKFEEVKSLRRVLKLSEPDAAVRVTKPATATAAPAGTPASAQAPVDINLERTRAMNAIKLIESGKAPKGLTADVVRQKFQKKTGQAF